MNLRGLLIQFRTRLVIISILVAPPSYYYVSATDETLGGEGSFNYNTTTYTTTTTTTTTTPSDLEKYKSSDLVTPPVGTGGNDGGNSSGNDIGVPIKKMIQQFKWKKQNMMQQQSRKARLLGKEQDMDDDEYDSIDKEMINDKSDIEFLAKYYNDKRRESNINSNSNSNIDRTHLRHLLFRQESTVDTGTSTETASPIVEADNNLYDVIIIGAGWAGVAAAMTLESKGITNYKILEAQSYVGGRSRTVSESFNGEDVPLDYGSMWLHGGVDNPLYDIATQVGDVPMVESPYYGRLYKDDGSSGSGATYYTDQQLGSNYYQLYENGFMEYQEARQESTDTDEALQVSADKYVATLSSNEKKKLAKYFMRSRIEMDYTGRLEEVCYTCTLV